VEIWPDHSSAARRSVFVGVVLNKQPSGEKRDKNNRRLSDDKAGRPNPFRQNSPHQDSTGLERKGGKHFTQIKGAPGKNTIMGASARGRDGPDGNSNPSQTRKTRGGGAGMISRTCTGGRTSSRCLEIFIT